MRVAATNEFRGRSGLSRHGESGDLCFRRRPMLVGDDALHDRCHRRRCIGTDDPAHDVRLNDVPAVVPIDRANHARFDVLTAVRHGTYRRYDLQRRHRDLVTHRYFGAREVGPLLWTPYDPWTLAGKIPRHGMAKAVEADITAQTFGAELQTN